MQGIPLRYQKCAGDDNLDTNAKCTSLYRTLGYGITDYSIQVDTFSFCSTTFTNSGSYGDNIEKFFVGCMYDKDYWDDKMLAFDLNYALHPRYLEFKALLDREDPNQYTDRPETSLDGEDELY